MQRDDFRLLWYEGLLSRPSPRTDLLPHCNEPVYFYSWQNECIHTQAYMALALHFISTFPYTRRLHHYVSALLLNLLFYRAALSVPWPSRRKMCEAPATNPSYPSWHNSYFTLCCLLSLCTVLRRLLVMLDSGIDPVPTPSRFQYI